jgi:hypothetical protein
MTQARITAEQTKAVEENHGRPVYLVDENGRDADLAIVRADLLKRIIPEGDLEDDFDIRETYPAQEQALASVWDDPLLDEYTEEDGEQVD